MCEQLPGHQTLGRRVAVHGRRRLDIPIEAVDRDAAVSVVQARDERCQLVRRIGHESAERPGVKIA